MHEVRIGRSATKELEALPDRTLQRIAAKIDSLAQQPRPSGCNKLRGADDMWRIRVGDYPAFAEVEPEDYLGIF